MTGMDTQEHQIDLGHLMAFDPLHHFPSPPTSRLGFSLFTPTSGLWIGGFGFVFIFIFPFFLSFSCNCLVPRVI